MNTQLNFKNILGLVLQILGAMLAFVFSLILFSLILPLSPVIMEAKKAATGFLPIPMDFLFNAAANALIMAWAARRSSFKGLAMVGQLFVLSFGAQVFMTQIETGYFISAFPLLQGNFQLFVIVFRGALTSLLFSLLVALMVGGFSKNARPQTTLTVTNDDAVKQGAWLAAVYVALYMLFGYFVAWQVREVRLFYGGPSELNGLLEQWSTSLMQRPEILVFQYFRGILWMVCLVPLFKGFSGKRTELAILSGLALALLPTAQLAFANALMPAAVSLGHFWEVSVSTGLFGALCAWFVPEAVRNSE